MQGPLADSLPLASRHSRHSHWLREGRSSLCIDGSRCLDGLLYLSCEPTRGTDLQPGAQAHVHVRVSCAPDNKKPDLDIWGCQELLCTRCTSIPPQGPQDICMSRTLGVELSAVGRRAAGILQGGGIRQLCLAASPVVAGSCRDALTAVSGSKLLHHSAAAAGKDQGATAQEMSMLPS